ncbi:hypothetical protein DB88DRAFT_481884 [Papiliotrema laurentii]|uniref:J domain-containing protein n=1 Tax=Papiliotrema laurentii TaxID=5418 RepID=A0AAD9L810_PAPLA|nr:hypothetical protein DB88DRAFT_481884 [Papiliotrema laurentii]
MPLCRAPSRRLAALSTARSSGLRSAHAAAANREDEDPASSRFASSQHEKGGTAGEGIPRTPGASDPSSSSDRKGKGRARDPSTENYRFPVKGRDGGPPGPFDILGLDRNASQAEIKSQYYRLALLLHPDSSHPSSSQSNFATLNRAYTLLSNSSSRQSYLHYGQGWTPDGGTRYDPIDPMLQEVLRRKRDGAGRRGRSEAGRGAWGAYGMDGKWYDFPEAGVGAEPKYMSHPRFASVLFVVGGILAWIQYHRLEMGRDRLREATDAAHLDASHALAQAREEAKLHGHARREGIKRRINETRVLREIERQEREANALRQQAPAEQTSAP